MVVTPFSSVIVSKYIHPSNRLSAIESILLLMVNSFIPVYANALLPILVIVVGKVIFVKYLQFWKVLYSIDEMESSLKSIDLIPELLNASCPI